jgi:hypothetical protein
MSAEKTERGITMRKAREKKLTDIIILLVLDIMLSVKHIVIS